MRFQALGDALGLRGWRDGILALVLAVPPLLVQALPPTPPVEATAPLLTVDLVPGPLSLVGSPVWAVLGLLLLRRLLFDLVPRGVATATAVLLLYATFLYGSVVHEPATGHALGFFASALVLSVWWRGRAGLSPGRALALGLLAGLAADVRWTNAVLLVLPAATLLGGFRRSAGRALGLAALTAAASALAALPRILAWRGGASPLLPQVGSLAHPACLETLFSSRQGLLYWTPLLWGGFLGYVPALRRWRGTAATLLASLLLLSYLNACSPGVDAGSFPDARFDSALPLLGVGLAAALGRLRTLAERRPGAVVAGLGAGLVLWNLLFMEVYRRVLIPADDTVSFARVTEAAAGLVSRSVGTPVAWPANWIFAWEHALPVEQYDLTVGTYLFDKPHNLGGLVRMGDARADPALLDEGWSSPRRCEGEFCRGILERARILAPLAAAETLDVTVRAEGQGVLRLSVNGAPLASLPLARTLGDLRVRVPSAHWRREVNEVGLDLDPGSEARVASVLFDRPGMPR